MIKVYPSNNTKQHKSFHQCIIVLGHKSIKGYKKKSNASTQLKHKVLDSLRHVFILVSLKQTIKIAFAIASVVA